VDEDCGEGSQDGEEEKLKSWRNERRIEKRRREEDSEEKGNRERKWGGEYRKVEKGEVNREEKEGNNR
jgi:hypothetical protein